jgi:hypothetical protein
MYLGRSSCRHSRRRSLRRAAPPVLSRAARPAVQLLDHAVRRWRRGSSASPLPAAPPPGCRFLTRCPESCRAARARRRRLPRRGRAVLASCTRPPPTRPRTRGRGAARGALDRCPRSRRARGEDRLVRLLLPSQASADPALEVRHRPTRRRTGRRRGRHVGHDEGRQGAVGGGARDAHAPRRCEAVGEAGLLDSTRAVARARHVQSGLGAAEEGGGGAVSRPAGGTGRRPARSAPA